MGLSIDDYFRKKLWALMHDPPNKAWVMINGKDHVSEAMRIYDVVFKETGIRAFAGGVPPYNDRNNPDIRLVNEADKLASSFDRWAFMKPGPSRYIVKNTWYLNIFKPGIAYELTWNPDFDKRVNDYVDKMNSMLKGLSDKVKNDARAVYNLFYTLYETLWVGMGLPPSPADTRAPTHDVFDHDYATAMLMNWFMNGKFTGYYVIGDIPGVQSFITASRRAGDLWASSWTLSMTIWLTIWPLIWRYGPDILIRPTARLNPMYYAFLMAALDMVEDGKDPGDVNNLCELFKEAIALKTRRVNILTELLSPIIASIPENAVKVLNKILSVAFIGESFQLVIPSKNPEGNEVTKDKLVDELTGNFKKATECIVNIARAHMLPRDDYVTKLIDYLWDNKLIELRLPLRVAVLNIAEVYGKYRNTSKCPLGDDVLREFNITNDECLDNFFFNYIMTNEEMRRLIREEEGRRIPTIGSWFDEKGKPLFRKEYGKDDGDWVPSTLNPEAPAVVRFSKKVRNNVLCYNEETTEWLKKVLGIDPGQNNLLCEDINDTKIRKLMSTFKPGEALSPIDLAKRIIHLGYKQALDVGFESIDDVAVMYLANIEEAGGVYGRGECRDVWDNYIKASPPRDVDNICIKGSCGNPELIRNHVSKCVDAGLDEATAKEILEGFMKGSIMDSTVIGKAGSNYVNNAVKELLNFHFTYAIIRGDGDSLGEIHSGNLPNYYNELREFYNHLLKNADTLVDGDKKEFEEDVNRQLRLLADLENKLKGRIPISPAYKFAITKSLMVTALKTLTKLLGISTPIYIGGDDILALAPIETTLNVVETARRTYWALDEEKPFFHKLSNYVVPALAAYGQSYSVRFTHLFDIFVEEYQEAGELLDEEAKEADWGSFKKDSLTISHSRTETVITVPIKPRPNHNGWVIDLINDLRRIWTMLLTGLVSSGLPEDLDKYSELLTGEHERDYDLNAKVFNGIIMRNIKGLSEDEAQKLLSELFEHGHGYREYGSRYIFNIISGIKILRRLP